MLLPLNHQAYVLDLPRGRGKPALPSPLMRQEGLSLCPGSVCALLHGVLPSGPSHLIFSLGLL